VELNCKSLYNIYLIRQLHHNGETATREKYENQIERTAVAMVLQWLALSQSWTNLPEKKKSKYILRIANDPNRRWVLAEIKSGMRSKHGPDKAYSAHVLTNWCKHAPHMAWLTDFSRATEEILWSWLICKRGADSQGKITLNCLTVLLSSLLMILSLGHSSRPLK